MICPIMRLNSFFLLLEKIKNVHRYKQNHYCGGVVTVILVGGLNPAGFFMCVDKSAFSWYDNTKDAAVAGRHGKSPALMSTGGRVIGMEQKRRSVDG